MGDENASNADLVRFDETNRAHVRALDHAVESATENVTGCDGIITDMARQGIDVGLGQAFNALANYASARHAEIGL